MGSKMNSFSDDGPSTSVWLMRICVVCSIVMLGLPVPQGYDIAQHVRFASAYQESLSNGILFPGWSQFENFGFGGVGLRFYPPFADYVLGLIQFVTHDWYDTFLINSFFWMIPGCIGVFVWVRDFRSARTAFIASALYAAFPYHLLQIYRMQLYSEFVASAILPFCFLFVTRITRRGNALDVMGLAVSVGLLVLTHLPSTLIGLISLAVYAALIVDRQNPLKPLLRIASAGLISLGLTAFYIVRLVSEVDWVKHSGDQFSSGFFDHRRHFFPILFSFGDGYWEYSLWRLDLSVILGLVLLLLLGLKLAVSAEGNSGLELKVPVAVCVTGLISIFMLSVPSAYVWNLIPTLQKIQFPWRFLAAGSLLASVAAAVLLEMPERRPALNRVLTFSTIVLLAGMILFDVSKVVLIDRPGREEFYKLSVDTRDSEGCECWWPKWANRDAFSQREKANAGNRKVEIETWDPLFRAVSVGPGEATDLRIATFYYPHWKAYINSQAVAVGKDENGVLLIPIAANGSRVELVFEEPTPLTAAVYLSILSWIAIFAATASLFLFRRRSTAPR